MLVWMSSLLEISKVFYTENQRECFFRKVDETYRQCCLRLARDLLPADRQQEAEERILRGDEAEDWWKALSLPASGLQSFLRDRVYPALFEELEAEHYYVDQIYRTAPPEEPEGWYRCSTVKSLLHELINDEEDPYRIKIHPSDMSIAYLSYTICSFYTEQIRRNLHVADEDAEYMRKLLYCGEFAQNAWLDLVYREASEQIRPRVTDRFLYAFLAREYSMGMEPILFSEFLHDEITAPLYLALCEARGELLDAAETYLTEHPDPRWTPAEMERFFDYVAEHVKLDLEEPRFDCYLPGEDAEDGELEPGVLEMLAYEDDELSPDGEVPGESGEEAETGVRSFPAPASGPGGITRRPGIPAHKRKGGAQ